MNNRPDNLKHKNDRKMKYYTMHMKYLRNNMNWFLYTTKKFILYFVTFHLSEKKRKFSVLPFSETTNLSENFAFNSLRPYNKHESDKNKKCL